MTAPTSDGLNAIARSVLRLLSCMLCAFALAGCASQKLQRFEFESKQMGTSFRLLLYTTDGQTALEASDELFRRVADLNQIFSDYEPLSEVSRLSELARERAPTPNRPLSDELYEVLRESKAICADSDGAFDVTIGVFSQLWRRAKRQGELPTKERLDQARAAFGNGLLVLDPAEHSARLLARGMRLDLGGIAVGYTLDDVAKGLRARGIDRFLIDGGGDVLVGDPPPSEPGWKIAVDDMTSNGLGKAQILVSNEAITTSGDGFKSITIDGVRYSHILDPKTGLGLTRRIAATVIAKRAIDADVLATTCCVLGDGERTRNVLEKRGAVARIVTLDAKGVPDVVDSPGFHEHLLQ